MVALTAPLMQTPPSSPTPAPRRGSRENPIVVNSDDEYETPAPDGRINYEELFAEFINVPANDSGYDSVLYMTDD